VTTLRLLVVVNFSDAVACALYHFGLETAFPWLWLLKFRSRNC